MFILQTNTHTCEHTAYLIQGCRVSCRVNSCHVDLRCNRSVSIRAGCQSVSIRAVSIRVMPSFQSVPCQFVPSAIAPQFVGCLAMHGAALYHPLPVQHLGGLLHTSSGLVRYAGINYCREDWEQNSHPQKTRLGIWNNQLKQSTAFMKPLYPKTPVCKPPIRGTPVYIYIYIYIYICIYI